MSLLTLSGVSCAAPDSRILFSGLDLSIGQETVGLVGRNGSGKSTLLAAIADDYPLAAGSISYPARIGMLRQLPPAGVSIADALGVTTMLERLKRIESGKGSEEDFERADWLLPSRLETALAAADLPNLALDRAIETLSGGERTRLMLAAMLLPEPELLLLDEPSNNLDASGRAALMRLFESWNGGILVASHDRTLLRRADRIVELTETGVHIVGGGWDYFDEVRGAAREQAEQALERSEAALARSKREAQREAEKQAQRDARGRRSRVNSSDPRILLDARKEQAEKTAARYRHLGNDATEQAGLQAEAARAQVERVTPIRIDLPPSTLAASHRLVEAHGLVCRYGERVLFDGLDLVIRGPERIVLEGPNGSGKTSFLRILTGEMQPDDGALYADHARMALLDQHLSLLDRAASLAEEMARHNPALDRNAVHSALAAYGFRNDWAEREVASLSGGERVRLALACLFSRLEPPQLLILDEPTNHLDIAATELLEQALKKWNGAILIVSHDEDFVRALSPGRRIVLG